MTVKEVVRNFLECTSLNSVPFVITAPNSCIKFLWVSIIVAGTGAMLFHLSYVVFTYLEYGTTTGITFKNSNLIFPDVLICNKNAVRKSKIPDLQSEPYKAFLKQFTNVNNSKPGKPIQNTLNITNPFKKTKTSWQQNVNTQMKLYYTSEPRDIRKEVSHQIDDMLLNCEFNGEKCSSKDFRLINTADYGNCYFFNPRERIINTPGAENGLHVQFFLQGNEFIPYLSQFGLQVLISVPHSIMFPNDLGIYASSNFETRISVRQNNITRMSGSYGTCNSSDAKLGKNKQIYTLYACTVLCEIEYAEKICHCVAPEDSDYAILLKSPMKIKYCNIEKTRCVEETKESTRNGSNPICSNRCYNPCNETTYSLTLSTQIWPDVHTVDNLVNFICQSNTTGCRYLNNLDYLQKRDNFAALTVFYDKMQYTYYEETASYGAVSFASDFGGTMGLWIGISALTLLFCALHMLLWSCIYFKLGSIAPTQFIDLDQAEASKAILNLSIIGIVVDVSCLAISLLGLYGAGKGFEGRRYLYAWILGMLVYILVESIISWCFIYWIYKKEMLLFIFITSVLFWVGRTIILIGCVIQVSSHFATLMRPEDAPTIIIAEAPTVGPLGLPKRRSPSVATVSTTVSNMSNPDATCEKQYLGYLPYSIDLETLYPSYLFDDYDPSMYPPDFSYDYYQNTEYSQHMVSPSYEEATTNNVNNPPPYSTGETLSPPSYTEADQNLVTSAHPLDSTPDSGLLHPNRSSQM